MCLHEGQTLHDDKEIYGTLRGESARGFLHKQAVIQSFDVVFYISFNPLRVR